jgi:nucleoside recognition membrane protein YjiH
MAGSLFPVRADVLLLVIHTQMAGSFIIEFHRILRSKAVEVTKQKKTGENLSLRNRKVCHSVSTALMQSVANIGTQSTMESSIKTLHEFTSHIPQKRRKGT